MKIRVRGSSKRRGYVRYTNSTLKQIVNTAKETCEIVKPVIEMKNYEKDANHLINGSFIEKIDVISGYTIPHYKAIRFGAKIIRRFL